MDVPIGVEQYLGVLVLRWLPGLLALAVAAWALVVARAARAIHIEAAKIPEEIAARHNELAYRMGEIEASFVRHQRIEAGVTSRERQAERRAAPVAVQPGGNGGRRPNWYHLTDDQKRSALLEAGK